MDNANLVVVDDKIIDGIRNRHEFVKQQAKRCPLYYETLKQFLKPGVCLK